MASQGERVVLDVTGREVAVSNPNKVYFPQAGITKLTMTTFPSSKPILESSSPGYTPARGNSGERDVASRERLSARR